jgi:DNA-binding transcriptional MerR regulator
VHSRVYGLSGWTSEGGEAMTIKEVCEQYDIKPDTLRYYERVGVIPEVHRTESGIRDYTDEDLKWVKNAICMRAAGVPIEMLIEYVRLYPLGAPTFEARRDLLADARTAIVEARRKYDIALAKLDYKISKYDEALETGVLEWDAEEYDRTGETSSAP